MDMDRDSPAADLRQTSSTPDYTIGYNEELIRFMASYDARESLGYVKGQLQPGMRALDVGCGPGFVSVQLAERIAPGELHGIDIEPSQIEIARHHARQRNCDTAKFQVGDAMEIPFEDGHFDLVHCSNVLTYIPDTPAVLREVMRVLKPGGLLACRDIILDSCFVHPESGIMARGWQVLVDLIAADDGHPQMGKELKTHLSQAGFEAVRASASFESYSRPDEIAGLHRVVSNWFLSGDILEPARQYGAATEDLFQMIDAAIDEWKSHPGAFAGVAVGHALAVRPGE